jgi:hypothetical protein
VTGRPGLRLVQGIHWVTLIGALVGAALFVFAWVGDEVHVLTTYGAGGGPNPHFGYGTLAEMVFLALPDAVCFFLAWITAAILRFAYRATVVRRMVWATASIVALGVAVLAFEAVVDSLGNRARAKEASDAAQADRIAGDHDALAAYARSHDVNQPMTPGGATPLHAAIVHRFVDLVPELLDRGAAPTEDDLVEATRGGDVATVRAVSASGLAHGLRGSLALSAAFEAGDADMLALLAAQHMDVAGTLPTFIHPQKLTLHPGEVDWSTLRARWQGPGPTPDRIAREIQMFARGNPAFPASEKDVLLLLDAVLASMDLCLDKTLASLPLEPWMRETRLCTCNYCPYVRQINWAILAALYPQAIPTLDRSKHLAMLRALARDVVQVKADQEPSLRTAVDDRNVTMLEVLENAGFDVRQLDGKFAASSFLSLSDEQRMKKHLLDKGVRLRE